MKSADDATVSRILAAARRIAVVGASERPSRDSHSVTHYLIDAGFEVYPVNPNLPSLFGRPCAARLEDIGVLIDTVVCFRRSDAIEAIAHSAIAIGAHHLWMQLGVVNSRAQDLARAAGLEVVMDRCIRTDHRRWVSDRR